MLVAAIDALPCVSTRGLAIGVVGLGSIGQVHARNLVRSVEGASLRGVADSSRERSRTVGEELGVPWADSAADLLDRKDIDAVLVCSPPSTHSAMVQQAARAGKHVFCEKPLALRVEDAQTAVEAAKRAGIALQVGFHRRFDAAFAAVQTRIRAGELGEIRFLSDSMRDVAPPPVDLLRTEQSLLHDATCHGLDSARWLLGEITELAAFGAALSSPEIATAGEIDHLVLHLRFESGALGVIESSFASGYGFDCRCEVVGSAGTARIEMPSAEGVRWLTPGRESRRLMPTFMERFADAYPRELESFTAAIDRGAEVAVNGEDGLAAVVLAYAAERSLAASGPITIDRVDAGEIGRYRIRPSP
jgi:predicted dehydrogenase